MTFIPLPRLRGCILHLSDVLRLVVIVANCPFRARDWVEFGGLKSLADDLAFVLVVIGTAAYDQRSYYYPRKRKTYTKCRVSASFHADPPSFRALTRSVSSASLSSTIRSTSWLLPDLAEVEDEDSSRSKPSNTGARDWPFDLESPVLLLPVRCLPLLRSF